MVKGSRVDGKHKDRRNQILMAFSMPKTPGWVEQELGIKKLKVGAFLEKGLIQCLNPMARKGRLYVLTSKAKKLLRLQASSRAGNKNWFLIGYVMSSPRQKTVVLKTVHSVKVKMTSEEIRERASRLNPHLSRISTKGILKELVSRGLIETEMNERKRYYWITEKGRLIVDDVGRLFANKK